MGEKNEKEVLVSKIIAFERGTTNSHNLEQDTCHWQSICYKTPLRFTMSLKQADILEIRFLQNNKKILWKCSHADFI